MNHKHLMDIILNNNVKPNVYSETKTALRLIAQKEKFILEDAIKALHNNPKVLPTNGYYTIAQYITEINKIIEQYYLLYILISQFEAFLRTYINHKMVKHYGNKWHKDNIMNDLSEFSNHTMQSLAKPSQALNSISFGTLELVFFDGSRYAKVFETSIKKHKIIAPNGKPKYSNKSLIKNLFSIIRNARNDICHHRRIGESIKSNPYYTRSNMTKSSVINAINDLKILLGYNTAFDVKTINIVYK